MGVEDIEEEGEEELTKGREGGESTLVRWGVLPGRYLCKYYIMDRHRISQT